MMTRFAVASAAVLLLAFAARADDPEPPAADAPPATTVAAEPALRPPTSAVSPTKPVLGFEVRVGGDTRGPMLGAARTVASRGEVLLELGYRSGWVYQEFAPDDARASFERRRHYPMFGLRAGVTWRAPREEERGQLFLGAAVFVRRPIATVAECLPTTRGCEPFGGWMTGLVLYAGAEGRLR